MSLNMEDIEEIIVNHMKDQPFTIICDTCGMELVSSISIDSDLDLNMTVEPCETCLEEAKQQQENKQ